MSKASVINQAPQIASDLSDLLSLDQGKDFRRVADALHLVAAHPPPITHMAWQAVATIAQACLRTIGQHYHLSRARKRHLWRACAWSVMYTTLYAHHRREECIAALIRIECKSGGIYKDLDKHRRLKQFLRLSPNQVLCVKLNARPQLALRLSRGFGITVVDQQTIFDVIQAELAS